MIKEITAQIEALRDRANALTRDLMREILLQWLRENPHVTEICVDIDFSSEGSLQYWPRPTFKHYFTILDQPMTKEKWQELDDDLEQYLSYNYEEILRPCCDWSGEYQLKNPIYETINEINRETK
jgi:hypothetical protein